LAWFSYLLLSLSIHLYYSDGKDFFSEATWRSNWHCDVSVTVEVSCTCWHVSWWRNKLMCWLLRLSTDVNLILVLCFVLSQWALKPSPFRTACVPGLKNCGSPAFARTELKWAPDSFRAIRDVILSAQRVCGGIAPLHHSPFSLFPERRAEPPCAQPGVAALTVEDRKRLGTTQYSNHLPRRAPHLHQFKELRLACARAHWPKVSSR